MLEKLETDESHHQHVNEVVVVARLFPMLQMLCLLS